MVKRNQRESFAIWTVVGLAALTGSVNLLSAAAPALPGRLSLLRQFLPFGFQVGGRWFAAVSGFFLLMLATNLLRRKRLAWQLTLGLSIVSIIGHFFKGLDFEEMALTIILLAQLLGMRRHFTAQSDRPSVAQGIRTLLVALVFTLVYGTLGFLWRDRQYAQSFNWIEALQQTLAMFFTADNAGLEAITPAGQFFAYSIYLVGTVTLSYSLWMLLRPVIWNQAATEEEQEQARQIVEQYGCSSLARFALLPDKSYYFSPSGKSVIAFVPKGRGAIALGDPIGPEEDREVTIAGFKRFCAHNDWYPAFYQTLPDDLALYQQQGFRCIKIGEEAIVDLKRFTLQGKAGRNLRTAVNKFTKQGTRVVFYEPPLADHQLQILREISDEWLQHQQGSEKQFSLGWFDEDYLRDCTIAVVETAATENHAAKAIAFANIIPEYQKNDITIDLMRHRADIERGTMDFLFVELFKQFQAQGYEGFNLGLAALTGLDNPTATNRLEKGLHYLYEHLERFYRFQGLRAYKEKFSPDWEPRYLVYPRLVALPDVVVALIRADSGDRLLDYFRPGS